MVSLASLELPTGVRLEPSFEAALLRQDSVMRATYQGRNSMPFHGEHHPEAVLDQVYLEYLPRCRKAGIPIDVAALGRAAKFHDALMHVDPRLLNFPSPEHLAAVLTTNQALSEGCSKAEAERCGKIVMATHPDVRPTTPEEIIIRAADLANLAGNYQEFESATHLLHKEAQLRRGDSIAFERWLPGAYAYLRKYLYPMLELTPAARDQEGRSAWHTAVLSNISTLWAKTYQNSQCVVDVTTAECCQFPAQTPSLLYVRVHAVEEQRQRMLTELAQVCPADAAAFVVPGDVRRVPLPEACCHELILDQVDASAFNEAARVLKPHGLLRLRGSENLIALSELVLEARRAGFGYIGSDQGDTQQCFRKLEAEMPQAAHAKLKSTKSPDSLRGWAQALEDAKLPQFGEQLLSEFREPMASRYQRLRELGLLRVPVQSFALDSALLNPQAIFEQMPAGPLFVFLEPRDASAPLPRWHGRIEPVQFAQRIQELIAGHEAKEFTITVQPAFEILYNANIMVHSDGSVLAEFADGKDLPSRMNSRILFSAQRAALTGLYSYSTQDPKQRELAYQLLRELPGEGQGRERQLTPGYYEVALAKDSNAGALRPLFFDYRRHPFFLGTGGT